MSNEKTSSRDVMLSNLERDVIAKMSACLERFDLSSFEALLNALANIADARSVLTVSRVEALAEPLRAGPAPTMPSESSADALRTRVEARVLESIDHTLRTMESRGAIGWYQIAHEDLPRLRALKETLASLRGTTADTNNAPAAEKPVPMIGDARWRAGFMVSMPESLARSVVSAGGYGLCLVGAPYGADGTVAASLLWLSGLADEPTTRVAVVVPDYGRAGSYVSAVANMNERSVIHGAHTRVDFPGGASVRVIVGPCRLPLDGWSATHLVVPGAFGCEEPAVLDAVAGLAHAAGRVFFGAPSCEHPLYRRIIAVGEVASIG